MLIRRLLTIPLIIAFAILLPLTLLIIQLNATIGNPKFYGDQMEKADVYNFIYDAALPAALDETSGTDYGNDFPIELDAIKPALVSAARKILPAEWLKQQFEAATEAMIPYSLGDRDEFTYTLPLKERVEIASTVIKDDILHGDTFASIKDDLISYIAEEILSNTDQLPYDLELDEAQLEASLNSVFSEEWLASQMETAIDALTPYITGDANHFNVTFDLHDRADDMAAASLELIGGPETYAHVLDEMIEPTIAEYLERSVDLPYGISLSQKEISGVIEEVLLESWVEARLKEVVDSIAAYSKGETDSVALTVYLDDRKEVALDVMAELADQKMESAVNSLPECNTAEFVSSIHNLPPGQLPDCRPPGMSYRDFKRMLGTDVDAAIASSIDQAIGDQIPNQWHFTDAEVRQWLGAGNEDFLNDARKYVSEGWVFTDADLLAKLSIDDEETLEDVRDRIGNGYTLTEADIQEAVSDIEGSFDDARHGIKTARTWLWTLWIIPVLLLIGIGLLGGRNWKGWLIWALATLFITSFFVCIITAAVYAITVEPQIKSVIDLSDHEGLALVMAEKGNEMLVNIGSTFESGIIVKTIIMMVVSGAGLMGVIGWSVFARRRKPETPQGETAL
ncbi:MAG: hypothetical protein SVM79_02850 [Chloroflexota bacterium]|nr:hypothetical protein [Chloroflexota bacterium]